VHLWWLATHLWRTFPPLTAEHQQQTCTAMPRIEHAIDPFLLRIYGDFGIRWYSLAYIMGFLLVRWYLVRAARAGEVRNLNEEGVDNYVVYAFIAALLGARLFHVFVFELGRYGFDPVAWIAVWRGGLSFHGGLTGVAVATFLFCRRNQISFYGIADRAVIPIAITLGFGRIANFINAEMYGTLYSGPFCVDYSGNPYMASPPAGCRHPTQLYQMLKNWLLAAVLWGMLRRWRPPPGVVFWSFVGLYGFVRFFLMFVREEERVWMGLTQSQIFSGLMALLGAAMVAWLFFGRTETQAAPQPAPPPARRRRRRNG
jgi:phosphatidylglycerol---prolipoprotein diacylglyceryl transferase